MNIQKKKTSIIPFFSYYRYAFFISSFIFFLGLCSFFYNRGFFFGMDFSGGIQLNIDLKEKETILINELKKNLGNRIHILEVGEKKNQFLFKFIVDERNFDIEVFKKELLQEVESLLKIKLEDITIEYNTSFPDSFLIQIKTTDQASILKAKLDTFFYKSKKKDIQKDSILTNEKKLDPQVPQSKEVLYKLGLSEALSYLWIIAPLEKSYPSLEILEENIYEPSQGQILKRQSWTITLFVLFLILIYVGLRFEFKFAIAAIVTLLHDILIILSFVLLLGKEVDSLLLIAILTIIGYSLNDTIVIFDRIRENIISEKMTLSLYIYEINKSITLSLRRTIITSLTTLFVVFSILIFGGQNLESLASALFIGIISGTYSSIFIASPFLILWEKLKNKYYLEEQNS